MPLINMGDFLTPKNPLLKIYEGTVVDNIDPLKHGRVRVTIPNLLSGDTAKLPWMGSIFPPGLGGGSFFAVPEKNSKLVIIFPYNNIYFGYYVGTFQNVTTHNEFFDEDYPNSYGWIDESGNKFKINKKTGIITILHSSGTTIQILKDGSVNITSVANLNLAAKNININAETGNLNFGSGDCKANGISLIGHTHFAPHEAGDTSAPQ